MNELVATPINKEKSKKVFALTMILFYLLPILINSIGIVPLYTIISSNVAFQETPLPVLLKYLQEFLDLTSFSISFALIIFAMILKSNKSAISITAICAIFSFLRIPIKLVMNIFIYGSLGSSTEILLDILHLSPYFVFEIVQLLTVYIITLIITRTYLLHKTFGESKKYNKSSKIKNSKVVENKYVLPFSKFISWENPLQRSAIMMGFVVAAVKIILRIANDIAMGAPISFGEVMVMIAYYLSDFLYGIIAYIIALLLFTSLYEILKVKKKTDEEESPSAKKA